MSNHTYKKPLNPKRAPLPAPTVDQRAEAYAKILKENKDNPQFKEGMIINKPKK